jgi:lysophospholipase L1-like esterase
MVSMRVALTAVVAGNAIAWRVAGRRLVPQYLGPWAFTFHASWASFTVALVGLVAVRGTSTQRVTTIGVLGGAFVVVWIGEWFVRSSLRTNARSSDEGPAGPPRGDPQFLTDLGRFEELGPRYRNTRRTRESFVSPTLNFVEGWRLVPSTNRGLEPSVPRVLMFGGSTLVCIEVSDDATLPGELSRQLLERGLVAEVVNYGVMGATLRASWDILRATPLRESDVVIVYFGANDVNVAALFGGPARGVLAVVPGLGGFLRAIGDTTSSQLAHALARWVVTTDVGRLARASEKRAEDVADMADRIIGHVRTSGAIPVLVLQPHRLVGGTANSDSTTTESSATSDFARTADRQYTRVRDRMSSRAEFHDLSRILSDGLSDDLFLDWAHLTRRGNRIAAGAMSDLVVPFIRR